MVLNHNFSISDYSMQKKSLKKKLQKKTIRASVHLLSKMSIKYGNKLKEIIGIRRSLKFEKKTQLSISFASFILK